MTLGKEPPLGSKKAKIMHLQLEFWSVQIITGHVIYNCLYNNLTDQSSQNGKNMNVP